MYRTLKKAKRHTTLIKFFVKVKRTVCRNEAQA